jgi:hypothetical protein
MTFVPAPSDMLSELSACAHRLGVAFAAEAEREADWKRKLDLVNLFDRCFFSVRVAIGLQLRLRREASLAAHPRESLDTERPEGLEIERPEAPERSDARGHTYDERDRDRETERVSLPLLLATLNGVAKDAAALPGPPPAGLSALTALLARPPMDPAPRPAPRRPGHPGPTTSARHRSAPALTCRAGTRAAPVGVGRPFPGPAP